MELYGWWRSACVLLCCCSWAANISASVFTGEMYRGIQRDCVDFLGISHRRLEQYNSLIYPPDRDTMCLIRCIGISMGYWDDSHGFNVSFVEREFCPYVDDCFKKQLQEGISKKLCILDPLDSCARAFYSFRCFRRLLRKAIVAKLTATTTPPPTTTRAPFRPLTAEEILNIVIECADQVNLSHTSLVGIKDGILPDEPDIRAMIHCAGVRSGVYTDKYGANLDDLYDQLCPGEKRETFKVRQRLCLARNKQPPGTDACTVAFRQWFACLRPDYERYMITYKDSLRLSSLSQLTTPQPTHTSHSPTRPSGPKPLLFFAKGEASALSPPSHVPEPTNQSPPRDNLIHLFSQCTVD